MTNNSIKDGFEDEQPFMIGDRVDSGYNEHDVFYQLRTNGIQWFMYCRIPEEHRCDRPIYADRRSSYQNWLDALENTPNHPKGLSMGWATVRVSGSRESAMDVLPEMTVPKVRKEWARISHSAMSDIHQRKTSESGT